MREPRSKAREQTHKCIPATGHKTQSRTSHTRPAYQVHVRRLADDGGVLRGNHASRPHDVSSGNLPHRGTSQIHMHDGERGWGGRASRRQQPAATRSTHRSNDVHDLLPGVGGGGWRCDLSKAREVCLTANVQLRLTGTCSARGGGTRATAATSRRSSSRASTARRRSAGVSRRGARRARPARRGGPRGRPAPTCSAQHAHKVCTHEATRQTNSGGGWPKTLGRTAGGGKRTGRTSTSCAARLPWGRGASHRARAGGRCTTCGRRCRRSGGHHGGCCSRNATASWGTGGPASPNKKGQGTNGPQH
jgi:hypothetical protein